MKRKYPLKKMPRAIAPIEGQIVQSRRERNRRLMEEIARKNRISSFIFSSLYFLFNTLFGGNWACLIFWSLFDLASGIFSSAPNFSVHLPLLGFLIGAGLGLLFHTWQKKSSYLSMMGYGAIAGLLYGLATASLMDALQDALIGMLLGAISPLLVTLIMHSL